MPETGIGLFPDVGGTYFLPRLPGRVGMYLALTGVRLKAADLRFLGISTHIAPFVAFDGIVDTLAESGGEIHRALRPYADEPVDPPIAPFLSLIDRHFCGETVEQVLVSLDADGGDWATQTAATMRTKSPTSLTVTFRQMLEGRSKSFRACMALEYRLTQGIQRGVDFYEGVRATIVDKDGAPNWKPADLASIRPEMIDDYFMPLNREWTADE